MIKVITYGTYDLLHYGHIRLLERAKALGDYLIVGVTSDDFDKARGKINVQQSLIERLEAVKSTGLADEIIVEEYEGQKIDDIKRLEVDIFTVGSDWVGKFDYLNEYCKVVYLDRTEGVSSSSIRADENNVRIGFVGENRNIEFTKYQSECAFVNGAEIVGVFSEEIAGDNESDEYQELLTKCDAVYIASHPSLRYARIKTALEMGKHVLCKSPLTMKAQECKELFNIAKGKKLILMEAIKTAYSTAYNRLLLLLKSGKIGRILSIDATCTSLLPTEAILKNEGTSNNAKTEPWNSIDMWGPTALLPILQILGTKYNDIQFICCKNGNFDAFNKINFIYTHAVASVKVGMGFKSEGDLIVSGSKGYVYVPAPWWKTDYFEIRYEDQNENKRYFYQLDGEGIRFELVAFIRSIKSDRNISYIDKEITEKIAEIIENYHSGKKVLLLENMKVKNKIITPPPESIS